MDVKFLNQIRENLRLEWVITNLSVKLDAARQKNPLTDYSEQDKTLCILRDFQFCFLQTVEENRIIEKRYTAAFAKTIHQENEITILKQRIAVLEQASKF